MDKTIGLDLGTNSIGLLLRNISNGTDILKQIEYFTSVVFKSGVGKEKSGEFSYAAKRTEKRSHRRLYQSRKYRIWATLELLIENGLCPLSKEDLDKWRKYDKQNGLKRQYPTCATDFEQWVRLDFDGDGIPEYSSPYHLRAELMERQFDFTDKVERFKLGRALYHIAQRRGFKSSKGETISGQDSEEGKEVDVSAEMKKSEEKTSGRLVEYMKENGLATVGTALYQLEKTGVRIRKSEYKAVRSQFKEEINCVFDFQKGLSKNSELFERLVSEKKGVGTIFYKRPLRSQKGLVGHCTLEPTKSRCPISHPEYEKFRAWCFINNIRFGENLNESLTLEQKIKLYEDKFLLSRSSFKFEEIRVWIEKQIGRHLDYKSKTVNYKDKSNVSGCPISGRLRNLLGDNWESWHLDTSQIKTNKKTGVTTTISYSALDLWHVCFSFDEPEYVEEFAKNKLGFEDKKAKEFVRIYGAIQQGYGMLSLKAIRNINRFLEKGLGYSDAVLLAKLPDIFQNKWHLVENEIQDDLQELLAEYRNRKQLFGITNVLIANYKSLDYDEDLHFSERFADRNCDYELQEDDYKEINRVVEEWFGSKSWGQETNEEKNRLICEVATLYQQFFSSSVRDYYKLPKVSEELAGYLKEKYTYLSENNLKKIYHPSMIEFYAPAKETLLDDGRLLKLLGSPVIGALKNPMAMRVLHILRRQINVLLKTTDEYGNSLIDENTRVVVETARELNDANMRWAIDEFQRQREAENREFEKIINEYYPNRLSNKSDMDRLRLVCDQHDVIDNEDSSSEVFRNDDKNKVSQYRKEITKYRLWLEQGCRCVYTGKIINIKNLFDDNAFDIEHTVPRSLSFDNSLANLTICDAYFNRTEKKNQLPSQLANYQDILDRIKPWFEKVEHLKSMVDFWKAKAKRAQDKSYKDQCIRQRHLWQMELDYWRNKVDRFTMTEVTTGFRNSQLVDTGIITKYAYHYLKTVFNKVEVQKGSITADFRKMLGIQSVDEKKSREKHSHHAIDAAVLTMIPTAAKRDVMLRLFYEIQEKSKLGVDVSQCEKQLMRERKHCGLAGNVSEIVPFIENNILVNHISKDQTLTPAKKKLRRRGKEIKVENRHGEMVNTWLKGDCIRGKLHGETFYGAITQAKKDDNQKRLLRDANGSIIKENQIYYVVRRELKYKATSVESGFKDWDELEKAIVDKNLFKIMKSQFSEGTTFKEACERGIYMYKRGKNGFVYSEENRKNKIRHVRCYSSVKNPLTIKTQTYKSNSDYKNSYYAEMGDLMAMCKYESSDHSICEYHIWSVFDVSDNRKAGVEDVPRVIMSKKKNIELFLAQMYRPGDMVLLYKNDVQELKEMDLTNLLQRLYVIKGFENPSRIILVHHLNAQQDNIIGKGESVKDYQCLPQKIRCGVNTLSMLVDKKDFEISPRGINFFKKL